MGGPYACKQYSMDAWSSAGVLHALESSSFTSVQQRSQSGGLQITARICVCAAFASGVAEKREAHHRRDTYMDNI
eukprot:9062318-Pyramimonas_sp.AAC.1